MWGGDVNVIPPSATVAFISSRQKWEECPSKKSSKGVLTGSQLRKCPAYICLAFGCLCTCTHWCDLTEHSHSTSNCIQVYMHVKLVAAKYMQFTQLSTARFMCILNVWEPKWMRLGMYGSI